MFYSCNFLILIISSIDDKDWPPRSSVIYGGGSASLTSHQAIYSNLSPLLHFTQLTSTIVVSLLFGQLTQILWYRWWFVFYSTYVNINKITKDDSKSKNTVNSENYTNKNNNNNHLENNGDYLVIKIKLYKFSYIKILYHQHYHSNLKVSKFSEATLTLSNYHHDIIIIFNEWKAIITIIMKMKKVTKNENHNSWKQ